MTKHASVDEYIAAQPQAVGKRLTEIRELFHELLPDTKESISYSIPAFTVGSERLYISGYEHHVGMYPIYGLPELEAEIAPYRGKGTKDSLHFKHDQPLPLELIKRIIVAKAKQ